MDNYDGIYSVKIIFVEFGRYIFNILFGGEYVLGIEKIWVIVKFIWFYFILVLFGVFFLIRVYRKMLIGMFVGSFYVIDIIIFKKI